MLKLWVKDNRAMTRAPAVPAGLLLAAVALALAVGGCAPPGWPKTPPSTAPGAAAEATQTPTLFGATKGPAYPSFGAPKQIGDRPVMTPDETAKMQSDLENTAKQREQQIQSNDEDAGQ